MTTALIPLDTLGATIRAHIEKGDASIEKAEQHYKSAGLHLAEAKARVKQTPGLTWPRFLLEHCQIRRARADELIMIADGRTTLADLRMKKAESVRAMRERQREDLPLRSGEPVAAITEAVPSLDVYTDDGVARLRAEIEALKRKLSKAQETIAEKESQRRAQENRASIAAKQAGDAANRAMFAEADKERLGHELEDMREEIDRLKEPGKDHESGLRRAEEMLLNEYYGVAETWLKRLGTHEEHPAHPHRMEARDAFLSEDIGFVDILMMVQHEAFGRLNDYFGSSCTWNGIPAGEFKDPQWRLHAKNLAERIAA